MLAALMVNVRCELVGFSVSKKPEPSNSLNEPRTLVTIAWRATNPILLWVGSMAYVPVVMVGTVVVLMGCDLLGMWWTCHPT
jgi:hypothetical protein